MDTQERATEPTALELLSEISKNMAPDKAARALILIPKLREILEKKYMVVVFETKPSEVMMGDGSYWQNEIYDAQIVGTFITKKEAEECLFQETADCPAPPVRRGFVLEIK